MTPATTKTPEMKLGLTAIAPESFSSMKIQFTTETYQLLLATDKNPIQLIKTNQSTMKEEGDSTPLNRRKLNKVLRP